MSNAHSANSVASPAGLTRPPPGNRWTLTPLATALAAIATAVATTRKEVIVESKPEAAAESVHLSWVNASRL